MLHKHPNGQHPLFGRVRRQSAVSVMRVAAYRSPRSGAARAATLTTRPARRTALCAGAKTQVALRDGLPGGLRPRLAQFTAAN